MWTAPAERQCGSRYGSGYGRQRIPHHVGQHGGKTVGSFRRSVRRDSRKVIYSRLEKDDICPVRKEVLRYGDTGGDAVFEHRGWQNSHRQKKRGDAHKKWPEMVVPANG